MNEQRQESAYLKSKSFWLSLELAKLAGVDYNPVFGKIIELAYYTIINEIAHELKDGQFKDEIYDMFGITGTGGVEE